METDCICIPGRTKYESVLSPNCPFHFPKSDKEVITSLLLLEDQIKLLRSKDLGSSKSASELFAELSLK